MTTNYGYWDNSYWGGSYWGSGYWNVTSTSVDINYAEIARISATLNKLIASVAKLSKSITGDVSLNKVISDDYDELESTE